MELKAVAAVAGGLVVSLASLAAGIVVKDHIDQTGRDGRSRRGPRSTRHAIRRNQFALADSNPHLFDGWFRHIVRCSWKSFNKIVALIEAEWDVFHGQIHHNAKFFIRQRVAVTLHYLTRAGSVDDSAKFFGMRKASALR